MNRRLLVGVVATGPQPLSADEAHYARDVLRLAVGDTVTLFDRTGREATARVAEVGRRGVSVVAEAPREAPACPRAVVILGQPRPALVDEAVTLGTEAGATDFWLVPAERSQVPGARLERWVRVATAAARQSRRAAPPVLTALPSLGSALDAARALALPRLVGDPAADSGVPPCAAGVVLAIGPEGGWSPGEQASLGTAGFQGVRLGDHVLRAPTAVAVGLALALSRW